MNTAVIAHNTFREATRDRVLAGVVVAGLVLMLGTQLLSPLALGEGTRLIVDLGLSTISLLGLVVVLLVGTSLVAKEIERRTIFNLLSRPMSRPAYLVGKWAGLSGALWLMSGILGIALWGILAAHGQSVRAASIAEATYLAGLELTVITACAVLFSSLATPTLSALYTLGTCLVGQWSDELRTLAGKFPEPLSGICAAAANVVPNLSLFNMRTLAASGETTTLAHLGIATLYALVYSACALALATAAFESKDFK